MSHRAKFRSGRSNRSRDMTIFRFLEEDGRPPCQTCDTCVCIPHEGRQVVFITVQILVEIDEALLIICTF